MELDYKAIGKRIKIARIKADLTQEKLSEMVGVSPTHLSNIETGTRHCQHCQCFEYYKRRSALR